MASSVFFQLRLVCVPGRRPLLGYPHWSLPPETCARHAGGLGCYRHCLLPHLSMGSLCLISGGNNNRQPPSARRAQCAIKSAWLRPRWAGSSFPTLIFDATDTVRTELTGQKITPSRSTGRRIFELPRLLSIEIARVAAWGTIHSTIGPTLQVAEALESRYWTGVSRYQESGTSPPDIRQTRNRRTKRASCPPRPSVLSTLRDIQTLSAQRVSRRYIRAYRIARQAGNRGRSSATLWRGGYPRALISRGGMARPRHVQLGIT